MIEVKNLAFSYRKKTVLRDVSFSVENGGAVCIVGANGAGKTTLLKIMASLAVPDKGSVEFDGSNIDEFPMRYRKNLGYLPEKIALYNDMSVKKYLSYRAAIKGEPAKRIRRRVSEAMALCGLEEYAKNRIGALSLGWQKRVAFADALLLRPRVLLLDDFLNGLDCSMRAGLGDIIKSAAAFSSVVVTGHEISDFSRWAKRFIVLKDGAIEKEVVVREEDRSSAVSEVTQALLEKEARL
jgi:ABC-2 type transport system ATP-binding protein